MLQTKIIGFQTLSGQATNQNYWISVPFPPGLFSLTDTDLGPARNILSITDTDLGAARNISSITDTDRRPGEIALALQYRIPFHRPSHGSLEVARRRARVSTTFRKWSQEGYERHISEQGYEDEEPRDL